MEYDGWIKLWRKGFFDTGGIFNNFGDSKKPWDEFHAWCYLLCAARYAPTEETTPRGQVIHLGELVTSTQELAEKWHWPDKRRVMRYLKVLERSGMITTHGTTHGTTITIEKYEKYQVGRTTVRYTDGITDGTTHGITDGTHNKNIRNKKEEGEERAGAREAPPASSGGVDIKSLREQLSEFYKKELEQYQ
ncbi:MAG: hypothetical protein KBS75_09245 [Bacteroidales bacterium]|nr:hypothetical protein [Candidatus Equimonas faecalis]